MQRIKNINDNLPGLLVAILFFGVVCEVIGIFFVNNWILFTISLWIGVFLAGGMAFHMAWVLDYAFQFSGKSAQKIVTAHNMLRFAIVIIVFGIILVTNTLNPLYTFLGLMALKVGAYLQPFTHKRSEERRVGKEC